jgi:putative ABC transport system ATP-binding protein
VTMGVLRDLHREKGLTIVMVTHDVHAASAAGRSLHMLDGRILSVTGSPPPAPPS